MDFALPEELRMLKELAREFVERELMPLERMVLEREAARGWGDDPLLPPEIEDGLLKKLKEIGLWGLDVPEEFGGANLGHLARAVVVEEFSRCAIPFTLPPDAPNLHLLAECCTPGQREKYLIPYATGAKRSCLALTEPNAGSDAAAVSTTAVRKGDRWVLNGTKMFITGANTADFMIVIAATDKAKRARGGITAFLVDKGTPGLTLARSIPTIGHYRPWEVVLEDVELPDEAVLGEVGNAFVPLSKRLGIRRLEIGTRCVGMATRCLELMIAQANQRETFGKLLADRQAIQWMIADSALDIHAARLMAYQANWKADSGAKDLRMETSMIKVFATEMATRVADRAIQAHGGYGVSREMPLEFMYRNLRVLRIVEGPSEIHRWQIARQLLKG